MSNESKLALQFAMGQRIRFLRYALYGLRRRKEFLDETGLDRSTLDRIEKGHQRIDFALALLLKRKYGVTYEWLIEGDMSRMPFDLAQAITRISRKSERKK